MGSPFRQLSVITLPPIKMDLPIRQALGSTLQIAYTRLIVLSNFRTFVASRRRQLGLALLSGILYFVGFCCITYFVNDTIDLE